MSHALDTCFLEQNFFFYLNMKQNCWWSGGCLLRWGARLVGKSGTFQAFLRGDLRGIDNKTNRMSGLVFFIFPFFLKTLSIVYSRWTNSTLPKSNSTVGPETNELCLTVCYVHTQRHTHTYIHTFTLGCEFGLLIRSVATWKKNEGMMQWEERNHARPSWGGESTHIRTQQQWACRAQTNKEKRTKRAGNEQRALDGQMGPRKGKG